MNLETNSINLGIKKLLEGHPIIFPTDTVYGLGCILNKDAIKKLYSLKKRDENKKIIALVSSKKQITELTDEVDFKVIDFFMPGPLSVVYKTKEKYKEMLGPTIGIRIPNNKIALTLIEAAGGILMTTSANISGEPPAINISDISEELLKNIEVIISTDETLSGIPSTIVSYIDGKYDLLREGQIEFKKILEIGGNNENS